MKLAMRFQPPGWNPLYSCTNMDAEPTVCPHHRQTHDPIMHQAIPLGQERERTELAGDLWLRRWFGHIWWIGGITGALRWCAWPAVGE
jgi:hypothetical protein